jgi:hypothetical protein
LHTVKLSPTSTARLLRSPHIHTHGHMLVTHTSQLYIHLYPLFQTSCPNSVPFQQSIQHNVMFNKLCSNRVNQQLKKNQIYTWPTGGVQLWCVHSTLLCDEHYKNYSIFINFINCTEEFHRDISIHVFNVFRLNSPSLLLFLILFPSPISQF